jgi:hypothetical protein
MAEDILRLDTPTYIYIHERMSEITCRGGANKVTRSYTTECVYTHIKRLGYIYFFSLPFSIEIISPKITYKKKRTRSVRCACVCEGDGPSSHVFPASVCTPHRGEPLGGFGVSAAARQQTTPNHGPEQRPRRIVSINI